MVDHISRGQDPGNVSQDSVATGTCKPGVSLIAARTFSGAPNRLCSMIARLMPASVSANRTVPKDLPVSAGRRGNQMSEREPAREDLIRTATALTQRVELQVEGFAQLLVIGFRRSSGSIYVGEDPVYHFNGTGELRRAHWQGKLVKAEAGKLVALRRQRGPGHANLLRHEWKAAEMTSFLEQLRQCLDRLRSALEQQQYRVNRQVPEDQDVVAQCRQWLRDLPNPIRVAAVANVH